MAPRSIVHRPADKISQLLVYDSKKNITNPFETAYQTSFCPINVEAYLTALSSRPTIDGYYTDMRKLIVQNDPSKSNELNRFLGAIESACKRFSKKPDTGQQRCLGSVAAPNEINQLTHGVKSQPESDIRGLIFPGEDTIDHEVEQSGENDLLKTKIHGCKSNSDRTGAKTLKALQYQPCVGSLQSEPVVEKPKRKLFNMLPRSSSKKTPINVILDRDLNEEYVLLEKAIKYLELVRKNLFKFDKSVVDLIRKKHIKHESVENAIALLSRCSQGLIEFTKLKPILEKLKIDVQDQQCMQRLWDLFDHNVPLSSFKFGQFVQPFVVDVSTETSFEAIKTDETKCNNRSDDISNATKFRNFDTAADLISPKPRTAFGLGHVDYFLPRRKDDIRTIFRSFDLPEADFEDIWLQARKLETCEMNKVSVESFRKIIHEKGIKCTE